MLLTIQTTTKIQIKISTRTLLQPRACANSTDYNTIDIINNYVGNQEDIHQTKLTTN